MINQITPGTFILIGSVLALLPFIISSMTAYVKISVVCALLRSAFGVQQFPGKSIEVALAISITILVMSPTVNLISNEIYKTKLDIKNLDATKLYKITQPIIGFLRKTVGDKELTYIYNLKKEYVKNIPTSSVENSRIENTLYGPFTLREEADFSVLFPAFLISELSRGFSMGFSILIPFLIVDLLVGLILAGTGLSMVSPTLISLPLKILLFVAIDGWSLLIRGLVLSYGIT
jgi:type III secretion protein R